MDLMAFLKECEQLETIAQRLYRSLARRFRRDRKAAEVFDKLAGDEESHARTFRFLQSLAREVDGTALVLPRFAKSADRFRQACTHVLDALAGGAPLALKEALRLSLKVETHSVEAHSPMLVEVANEQLRQILASVVLADKGHREELERLQGLEGALIENLGA